jgi:hypothetical protein
MCFWGTALVLGPNINAPMANSAVPKAYTAVQTAISLSDHASAKEQMLIRALSKRYSKESTKDRSAFDTAYAEVMKEASKQFPEDPVINSLFAEALMDLHPWNYWTKEGEAQPWTPEILHSLESALKQDPNNPLANHLYIHAVEASPHPERAVPSADRLRTLVPGAGHLVHMPAHIYIRIGRYHDASLANQRAVKVDRDYLEHSHVEGIYPIGYVPHNHHFLWAAATKEGRSALAIQAARNTAAQVNPEMLHKGEIPTLQHFYAMPLYALARFGKWDDILAEPAPAADLRYPLGVWHYARGLALIRKGTLHEAEQELQKLEAIRKDPAIQDMMIWDINSVPALLQIAVEVLSGELVNARGDELTALHHLTEAVKLEDALNYTEPRDWYFPPRQALGAVLLKNGRAKEAEKIYREDLKRNPENGWSLYGLAQSLHAQGRNDQAKAVEHQFKKAWANADVTLTSSRF